VQCEFCDAPAIATGMKFAGNHSEATGPFAMCGDDLKQYIEWDGLPLGDIHIIDQVAYDTAEGLI